MTSIFNKRILTIDIIESAGLTRDREPITFGIPFPRGTVFDSSNLGAFDSEENLVPTATTPLACWEDGSVKWVLFDMQISLPANGMKRIGIIRHDPPHANFKVIPDQLVDCLQLTEHADEIKVKSGELAFHINSRSFFPFSRITRAGRELLGKASRITVVDNNGASLFPEIDEHWVEQRNPLRLVVAFRGRLTSSDNSLHPLKFKSRIHFYAARSFVRFDFTVWNPQSARHPAGVWDLGDEGSVFFQSLDFELETPIDSGDGCFYSLEPGAPGRKTPEGVRVHQDSSGGKNWHSHNHIDKDGNPTVTFRGYRVYEGERVSHDGLRATPCVSVPAKDGYIAATIKHFWENFPKALECHGQGLKVSLFPRSSEKLFELQGGEQKTHTIFLHIGQGVPDPNCLDWIHKSITPLLSPSWWFDSGACPRPVPAETVSSIGKSYQDYQRLIDAAVDGKTSFFERREIIDEYGWRNFGDLYADHEAIFNVGAQEFVSHYNNQYDVIKGALVQFMRTGERSWFQLAGELAAHVVDIDIYHTDDDRWQFNHGLFWHTDHHLDAATCTHRSSSIKHYEVKDSSIVGGGPSYSHNYTTGFLYHYWLTGETQSKDAVQELAEFIVRGVKGPDTLVEMCILTIKRIASMFRKVFKITTSEHPEIYEFEGPGRASGNALNTLLDAYLATEDSNYIDCAEELISKCISPEDDIPARDLLNAEYRWMYNIFLQALGRYLDIKRGMGALDSCFWYGRSALLKYASWMLENEHPYLDNPELLEFPNETWAAQDIRKSDVLAHAAFYAPGSLRERLLEKSRFFFSACINQLQSFETRDLTRPIAILMANGMVHMDVSNASGFPENISSKNINYGLEEGASMRRSGFILGSLFNILRVTKETSIKKEISSLRLRLHI